LRRQRHGRRHEAAAANLRGDAELRSAHSRAQRMRTSKATPRATVVTEEDTPTRLTRRDLKPTRRQE
jgi:hypothetical protein